MPPKKNGPSNKTQEKAKQKIIEDKTFGLKNKNKSAKVNKYIQQVQQQVQQAGPRKANKEAEDRKKALEAKKKAEEEKKAELSELFKAVQQKVPFGVDPKTVLCVNFKNGACIKGDKCKFSHDLNVGRKSTKIDLYTDARDGKKEDDDMSKWDQQKLESVILSKHGNPRTTTDIVCKYFLEAIETQKYGWFWKCPNGDKECKYRHALPPGFVLKAKAKKDAEADKENEISLEELIETERSNLGTALTPVTEESFRQWKTSRLERLKKESDDARAKKEAAYRAGKAMHMSGRELFDFDPSMAGMDQDAEGDEEVFDISKYEKNDMLQNGEDNTNIVQAVDEELFANEDLDDLDDEDDD